MSRHLGTFNLVALLSRVSVITFGDVLQRVPGASAIDHRRTQIGAISTIPSVKGKIVGKIELLRHALRPQMVQMMLT